MTSIALMRPLSKTVVRYQEIIYNCDCSNPCLRSIQSCSSIAVRPSNSNDSSVSTKLRRSMSSTVGDLTIWRMSEKPTTRLVTRFASFMVVSWYIQIVLFDDKRLMDEYPSDDELSSSDEDSDSLDDVGPMSERRQDIRNKVSLESTRIGDIYHQRVRERKLKRVSPHTIMEPILRRRRQQFVSNSPNSWRRTTGKCSGVVYVV